MIAALLNLLRHFLWPPMWIIVMNVPCKFEKKKVHSATDE